MMFDKRSERVLADTTDIEMKDVGKSHPYVEYLKDWKIK